VWERGRIGGARLVSRFHFLIPSRVVVWLHVPLSASCRPRSPPSGARGASRLFGKQKQDACHPKRWARTPKGASTGAGGTRGRTAAAGRPAGRSAHPSAFLTRGHAEQDPGPPARPSPRQGVACAGNSKQPPASSSSGVPCPVHARAARASGCSTRRHCTARQCFRTSRHSRICLPRPPRTGRG